MHLSLFVEDGREAYVTVSGFVAVGGVTKVDTSSGIEEGSNHSCWLCIRYSVFCTVVVFVTVKVINFKG